MSLVDLYISMEGKIPKGNVQDEVHDWCEKKIQELKAENTRLRQIAHRRGEEVQRCVLERDRCRLERDSVRQQMAEYLWEVKVVCSNCWAVLEHAAIGFVSGAERGIPRIEVEPCERCMD